MNELQANIDRVRTTNGHSKHPQLHHYHGKEGEKRRQQKWRLILRKN
jgi:hypothetical protein